MSSTTRPRRSRRQFLRGIGGFTLALPFLPSLVDPREGRAAATTPAKRFVQMCSQHGGVWGSNMYPAAATLTDTMTYAGRTISRGTLALSTMGTASMLSPVLTAASALLTPALAAKMNLVRGCDIPFYIGHHTGGYLGNYARNDGNGADGIFMQAYPTPTIDQIMAWSPKFYSDLSTIKQRVLVVGPRVSYNWANPSTPANPGAVQVVAGSSDAISLFNQVFVSGSGSMAPDPNAKLAPVVDRVFADYTRLRTSNTRLSSADRSRLDDHMQRMSELQRRLNVHASCPSLPAVTTNTTSLLSSSSYSVSPMLMAEFYSAMNDVIVAAILCDTSRLAVMNMTEDFSTYVGDWHQDIAHKSGEPTGVQQQILMAANQVTFEKVFIDLCSKLDVDDGTGTTYLDNSLVVWAQESGEYTHNGQGMPLVMAGSAGGYLSTGNYIDYRDPTKLTDSGEQGNTTVKISAGLLWQQWLGTVLQAMGLQPSDYEKNGLGGYPTATKFVGSGFSKDYPDAVWGVATQPLPYLKKS